MTREELRDYVEMQRSLNNIPYHVYTTLIDEIDTLEQEHCDKQRYIVKGINNDKIEFVDKYSVRAFNRYVEFIKNSYKYKTQIEKKAIEQEPFINKPCVSEKACEHDKNAVLDRVKAEIDKAQEPFMADKDYDEGIRFGLMLAYQIVNKYKGESEEV